MRFQQQIKTFSTGFKNIFIVFAGMIDHQKSKKRDSHISLRRHDYDDFSQHAQLN